MRVISGTARGTKLESIDDINTRPTLDRVKESLFNMIQNRIDGSMVLDLFAGSGAIGIEFISRGCQKVYFCDKSKQAVKMIEKNLTRTKFLDKSEIFNEDYINVLTKLSNKKIKFDFVYIDPPYKNNLAADSIAKILTLDLLKKDGSIIVETDEKERDLKEIEKLQVEVYDLRKYGRAWLIFLNRKE